MTGHCLADVGHAGVNELMQHTTLEECEAFLARWQDDDGKCLLHRVQGADGEVDIAAANTLLQEMSDRATLSNSAAMIIVTYMCRKNAYTGDAADYFANVKGFKEVADWTKSLSTNLGKWYVYKKMMLHGGHNVWDKFESVRGEKQSDVFSLGYGSLQLIVSCIKKKPVEEVVLDIREGMAIRKYMQETGEVPALYEVDPASSENHTVLQATADVHSSGTNDEEEDDEDNDIIKSNEVESSEDAAVKLAADTSTEDSLFVEDTAMSDAPELNEAKDEAEHGSDQESGGVDLQDEANGTEEQPVSEQDDTSAQAEDEVRSNASDEEDVSFDDAMTGRTSAQRCLKVRMSAKEAKLKAAKELEPYLHNRKMKGEGMLKCDLLYALGKADQEAFELEMHPPPKQTKRKLEEDKEHLEEYNDDLRDELEDLRARNGALRRRVAELEVENERLEGKVARLEVKIAGLEGEA